MTLVPVVKPVCIIDEYYTANTRNREANIANLRRKKTAYRGYKELRVLGCTKKWIKKRLDCKSDDKLRTYFETRITRTADKDWRFAHLIPMSQWALQFFSWNLCFGYARVCV